MADIRPFRALRPADNEKAREIAALPYDVVDLSEAEDAVKRHPLSFLSIDRPEMHFPKGSDPYAREVYEKAAELLRKYVSDKAYIKDAEPCYYIYELTMDGRTQNGIVAKASVDDYQNNVIKKHENTRKEKEIDRTNHVDICSAQTGPIFLAYRKNEALSKKVEELKNDENLLYDFTHENGVRNRAFIIKEPSDVDFIRDAFSKIPAIYIADGHHRAASAVSVSLKRREANPGFSGDEEFNHFLSVLFPDEELRIFDYNRVVKDLKGRSEDEFLQELQKSCELVSSGTGYEYPAAKGQFSVYLPVKDVFYIFSFSKSDIEKVQDDPVKSLDVSLLQDIVLSPLLGIEDPRTDKRIDFVGGIRGYEELKRLCNLSGDEGFSVAFGMYPTSMGELFDVADKGLLMPPKSTWFEPKLLSGLFVHEIEE